MWGLTMARFEVVHCGRWEVCARTVLLFLSFLTTIALIKYLNFFSDILIILIRTVLCFFLLYAIRMESEKEKRANSFQSIWFCTSFFGCFFCVLLVLLSTLCVFCAAETNFFPRKTTSPQTDTKKSDDIAISTVSILLPHDPKVQFIVESFNGCFKW
jgi:hypothetical protein